MRQTLFAFLLAMTLVGSALADALDDGRTAHMRGDYETAWRLLEPLADEGNAVAQFYLGFMYRSGQGVSRSANAAWKWYRRAADQGLAEAQNNLGAMYRNGQGVWRDYAEAQSWYRRAAVQGLALAQYNLGTLYANGLGVLHVKARRPP